MRALALGWLAGCVWLQTRSLLPGSAVSLSLMTIGVLTFGGVLLEHHRWRCVALLLAGICLGAGWSCELARHRLAEALPPSLEGRDLQLTGMVASLPDLVGNGQRFSLEVEQALDQDRVVAGLRFV